MNAGPSSDTRESRCLPRVVGKLIDLIPQSFMGVSENEEVGGHKNNWENSCSYFENS